MGEFDYFYPDRMAGRILGMGDVLTLIEKAEGQIDQEEAQAQNQKLMSGKFDFEDFLKQMQMIKRMGPLSSLLGMRSEEHTSELQSRQYLVCRLLLEKKKKIIITAKDFSKTSPRAPHDGNGSP